MVYKDFEEGKWIVFVSRKSHKQIEHCIKSSGEPAEEVGTEEPSRRMVNVTYDALQPVATEQLIKC